MEGLNEDRPGSVFGSFSVYVSVEFTSLRQLSQNESNKCKDSCIMLAFLEGLVCRAREAFVRARSLT